MPVRHQQPRQPLIRLIHARARELRMPDADRAELQAALTGHASCRDMTVRELGQVADALQKRQSAPRAGPRPVDASRPVERIAGMRARARQLAAQLGAGDAYLDTIARRQAGVGFEDAGPGQLRGVIAAVYRHAQRKGKPLRAVD